MKLLCGAIVLAYAPLALAGNNAAYSTQQVPAFVIQQLDVRTFPSELQPKHEKGKKTLGDYRYVTRDVDDKEKVVESANGTSQFTITVLAQNRSGIYVCANSAAQNASGKRFQRVLLLKRKNPGGLLKSSESWKDFDGCPVIGGDDNAQAIAF
jgi:hypothetical protein